MIKICFSNGIVCLGLFLLKSSIFNLLYQIIIIYRCFPTSLRIMLILVISLILEMNGKLSNLLAVGLLLISHRWI